jgi:hypothetical protein
MLCQVKEVTEHSLGASSFRLAGTMSLVSMSSSATDPSARPSVSSLLTELNSKDVIALSNDSVILV